MIGRQSLNMRNVFWTRFHCLQNKGLCYLTLIFDFVYKKCIVLQATLQREFMSLCIMVEQSTMIFSENKSYTVPIRGWPNICTMYNVYQVDSPYYNFIKSLFTCLHAEYRACSLCFCTHVSIGSCTA